MAVENEPQLRSIEGTPYLGHANRLYFSGRLSSKALRPGSYRLKLVAGIGGLHSAPVAKAFAVAGSHR